MALCVSVWAECWQPVCQRAVHILIHGAMSVIHNSTANIRSYNYDMELGVRYCTADIDREIRRNSYLIAYIPMCVTNCASKSWAKNESLEKIFMIADITPGQFLQINASCAKNVPWYAICMKRLQICGRHKSNSLPAVKTEFVTVMPKSNGKHEDCRASYRIFQDE